MKIEMDKNIDIEKTLLCTVSDDRFGRKEGIYEKTQQKIESIFKKNNFGITDFLSIKWADIEQSDFFQKNKALLSNVDAARNGRAYKPYAISEGLKLLNEGDFLIYTDCSPEMWKMEDDFIIGPNYSIGIIKNLCSSNNGILSAFVKWDTRNIYPGGLGIHTHENFTTDRCIKKMGLEKYTRSFMHASGMIVIQKLPHTVEFIDEWLYYNCIDECCALGIAEIENDYSFWGEHEDITKMGHRHDQSVSGLLINKYGYKLVDPPVNEDIPTYNFLNFCNKNVKYAFIDSNNNPEPESKFKKGVKVVNEKGHLLTIYEFQPENNIEWILVGAHRKSKYRTTEDKLRIYEQE